MKFIYLINKWNDYVVNKKISTDDDIIECLLHKKSKFKLKWSIIGLQLTIDTNYISIKESINDQLHLIPSLKPIYKKHKKEILENINIYKDIKIPWIEYN
jgi:hypothetical protein